MAESPTPRPQSAEAPDYKRVELVWPGKKTQVERVKLPFQVIERVNDVRRSEGGQSLLLDNGLPEWWPDGWRNKLIWGDNKYVLASLLDEFAGKIDLIYIDPPFATGADFSYTVAVGDEQLAKSPSAIEEVAYRDTWGKGLGSYLQMMTERLILARELLSPKGHLLVHLAPPVSSYMHVILDGILGAENFRNEIVVHRPITKNLQRQFDEISSLPQGHDVILWYSTQPATRVPNLLVPYEGKSTEGYWHRFWSGADRPSMRYELLGETPPGGQWKWERERALRAVENYDIYLREASERPLVDYWHDTGEQLEFIRRSATTVENWFPPSTDKVGDTVWDDLKAYENQKDYATQKHEELLARIIQWLTRPGGLVADFFSGSGTTMAVAERLGRRWIGCDLGRFAVQTSRKRLLDIRARPFEVLNLGRYERRYWQGITVGEAIGEYYRFIIDLFQGEVIPGFAHLHGVKAGVLIHIGATDAPVTEQELRAALDECKANGFEALDVLGWEWAMGLNRDGADHLTREYGIKVRLYNIPREVMDKRAVDAGDVHFFEVSVADLEAQVNGNEAIIKLSGFLPAIDDYMRRKVGDANLKWSDWIDYWSIDFEFDGEAFVNQWQAYRTRKNRALSLRSDPHIYEKPGEYTVVVKVVDIFGNDTTQQLRVTVG